MKSSEFDVREEDCSLVVILCHLANIDAWGIDYESKGRSFLLHVDSTMTVFRDRDTESVLGLGFTSTSYE